MELVPVFAVPMCRNMVSVTGPSGSAARSLHTKAVAVPVAEDAPQSVNRLGRAGFAAHGAKWRHVRILIHSAAVFHRAAEATRWRIVVRLARQWRPCGATDASTSFALAGAGESRILQWRDARSAARPGPGAQEAGALRVLVVGGAGYIGSHMVRVLTRSGHAVAVLDDLSTGHGAAVPADILVSGSALSDADLDRAFQRARPEIVMHFAALSVVQESTREPARYYGTNVGGAAALLQAMRRHAVRDIVFSSSASVYGSPERTPIVESHSLQPINPYGWSKLMVERMLIDGTAAYDIRAVALRYFNAAGADPSGEIGESHEPETHLVPNVLRRAAGRSPALAIFGDDHPTADGYCVRDYVHVNDLCDAHLLAMKALAAGRLPPFAAFNLGSERGYSVMQVLRAAEAVVGRPIGFTVAGRRAGDPAVLVASSEQARRVLGWRPRFAGIESIIETAWRWHSAPRY
jgi:UDP-glucose-4-epimerase GalE